MSGWIKLHRDILEKAIWKCSLASQKIVFLTLLLMANHKNQQWVWNGKKFFCKPGQFITSLESISKKAGVSIRAVRTSLVNFEKLEFLTNKSTKTGRLITIINWESYQVKDSEPTKELTDDRQSTDKAPTTNKKERKKEEELFDEFRVFFPGRKNGLEVEFNNFVKKDGWREALPLLKPAIENQKMWREQDKKNGVFVPQWKNLSTWMNQKCWTEEPPSNEAPKKPVTTSDIYMREHERQVKEWEAKNG